MKESKIFIIRDFEVDAYVGLALQYLAKCPPEGVGITLPGCTNAADQGHLFDDVVAPDIESADYVISFMDTPNANVGFELGLALGCGKPVALVCATAGVPDWLGAAPTSGYLVKRGVDLPTLLNIIEERQYVSVTTHPSIGKEILFLSPRVGDGIVGHELVAKRFPEWHVPDDRGWSLEDLPSQLEKIGEVVWLITPFSPESDHHDGQGNSLNAIIAGYAKAIGLPLRILKSISHRQIVDIEDLASNFCVFDELDKLLLEAEEKRKLNIVAQAEDAYNSQEKVQELERVFGRGELRTLDWFTKSLKLAKSVGLLSLRDSFFCTCFLVSPTLILTVWHAVSDHGDVEDYEVNFETLRESRKVSDLVWTSGSADHDAAILRLDAQIDGDLFIPLGNNDQGAISPKSRVCVIGYGPAGSLSISLDEAELIAQTKRVIHYRTPTQAGSSGSPVFDDSWNLIAMHHSYIADGQVNEGIRTDAIAAEIRMNPKLYQELGLQ